MRFKDKAVLVTGGASGIGLASVKAFAEEGANVMFSDISEENGRKALKLMKEAGYDVLFIKGDVSSEKDVINMIGETVSHFGKLDVIFNNAGIFIKGKIHEVSIDEWERTISINLKSVFLGSKYAICQMRKQGGGVIVNNSSCAGIVGDIDAASYCASKGGVALLTKSIAIDYATENIRANAICCGEIDTQMTVYEAGVYGKPLDKYKNEMAKYHPMNRIGKPEEVARAVLFLASDDASFITGTLLSVDGGLTAM
ncbi:MAG: SDR family oxidoreductase [Desulfobacterales bacterium]|nr:SDR family oxidoreductase [Desulfobacterales bacterium]